MYSKIFLKDELKNELYIGVPSNHTSASVISLAACTVDSLNEGKIVDDTVKTRLQELVDETLSLASKQN